MLTQEAIKIDWIIELATKNFFGLILHLSVLKMIFAFMAITLIYLFFTFTLVKRLGIPFFLCSHFFGFTKNFRIHAIVYLW